jgi:hypothetical protein
MNTDDIIAGMCLYGFIKKEKPAEQTRCLREIRRHYGSPVASIVEGFIKKDTRAALR